MKVCPNHLDRQIAKGKKMCSECEAAQSKPRRYYFDADIFNADGTVRPDEQAVKNVERDWPKADAAEKHRLAQADTLMRHLKSE